VDSDYEDWDEEPGDPEACTNASECTAGEIAARDIAEWSKSVYSSLPGGAGFVSVQEVGAGGGRRNYSADIWIAWLDPAADEGMPAVEGECPDAFEVEGDTTPRCTFFRLGL
jgi:hypothetical protein